MRERARATSQRLSSARAAAVALAVATCAAGARAQVRVEGVAALVGGTAPGPGVTVILRSDVALRARIARAADGARPLDPVPGTLLAATLDEIVGEVLIEREADRLRAARPGEDDIARERARLEAMAGGAERLEALLRATGASVDEIDAIAQRRAYVGAFLQANLEGSTVISDVQVQRAYDGGNHPFAGRPLEDVREPLRAWIAQRVLRRDVRRWVEVLRSRTTVRVLVPWRAGEDGDGG